ncbi:tetratricopeptide repeat-containing glycosyltransferase family protein [Nitrospirillum sp. BR 11752]|uniref:tetratricopeptide repeat-containing glycosyltransferase family protein n=1 Tax=Nitrospirillum sp. BR 11752 TaxID=3104293 RepID=UPI002EA27048|nr:tetratricopeptide repeat-containing glycosyltransferase family protein [Nitrospirillum sp. BR 11752]
MAAVPDWAATAEVTATGMPSAEAIRRAILRLQAAVAEKPTSIDIRFNLGVLLQADGRRDEAVAQYRQALILNPFEARVHNALGIAHHDAGDLAQAMSCFEDALASDPDDPQAHNNMGHLLQVENRLDDALAFFDWALALRPDYPEALNNTGVVLQMQGRLDQAIDHYRRALSLRPDYAAAHKNLGMTLLAAGRYEEGWREFEWRWQDAQLAAARRPFTCPQWRGEDAPGRIVLIHAEQGYGDSLQFCRYIPLVAQRGLRVVVEVPLPLVRLMRRLPGVDQVVAHGRPLPPFDLHCPMMSLPLAFGTTVPTIPAPVPYLTADPAEALAWRRRLSAEAPCDRRPVVGLVWAGAPRADTPDVAVADRRRSMGLAALLPLLKEDGVRFISLQKDAAEQDVPASLGGLIDSVADFADTAALISNLDLVISVDTAVAHLAAAMGVSVWLLNRFDSCWRWLRGRDDSPWYPTLRQFRQPRLGDWASVVQSVRTALAAPFTTGIRP